MIFFIRIFKLFSHFISKLLFFYFFIIVLNAIKQKSKCIKIHIVQIRKYVFFVHNLFPSNFYSRL